MSVGRRGQSWDNAVAESFFSTIKAELLDRRAWPTRAAAPKAIFTWIEGWYNTRRRPSTLAAAGPAQALPGRLHRVVRDLDPAETTADVSAWHGLPCPLGQGCQPRAGQPVVRHSGSMPSSWTRCRHLTAESAGPMWPQGAAGPAPTPAIEDARLAYQPRPTRWVTGRFPGPLLVNSAQVHI
ncbi:integrase core domain-containing protein [Micromonospora chalcea]|uniref:integrase core domain-containing protein n=1 Tax=Micromonospora chalcea TaxID=1874 RepID=UPI00142D5619